VAKTMRTSVTRPTPRLLPSSSTRDHRERVYIYYLQRELHFCYVHSEFLMKISIRSCVLSAEFKLLGQDLPRYDCRTRRIDNVVQELGMVNTNTMNMLVSFERHKLELLGSWMP
jgi:hypothetical protein